MQNVGNPAVCEMAENGLLDLGRQFIVTAHKRAVQPAFAQVLECDVADANDFHRAVEQLLP